MALYIPAVGEPYDCAKAAISLECSNFFPWPKDCVQIHQTPFPSQRVGSGHETKVVQPLLSRSRTLPLFDKPHLCSLPMWACPLILPYVHTHCPRDLTYLRGREEEEDGELPYHTIVIDCTPIGFADSMGIIVLKQVW